MLAATSGRWDEAETHFQAAIDFNARVGARPWLARTQFSYAQMLLGRRSDGDPSQAHDLLQSALATSHDLGMTALATRTAACLAAATA
jgi:hypothetical protein